MLIRWFFPSNIGDYFAHDFIGIYRMYMHAQDPWKSSCIYVYTFQLSTCCRSQPNCSVLLMITHFTLKSRFLTMIFPYSFHVGLAGMRWYTYAASLPVYRLSLEGQNVLQSMIMRWFIAIVSVLQLPSIHIYSAAMYTVYTAVLCRHSVVLGAYSLYNIYL